MSNDLTTTNSANDVTPTLVDNALVLVFRDNAILAPMCHQRSLVGQPGLTVNIPKIGTTLAMTGITTGANEADANDSTTVTTDVISLTAASKACYVTVSDILADSSAADIVAAIAAELGNTMVAYVESTIADLFAGFSNTVGTDGIDLTVADIRSGLATLRINAPGAAERAVIALHPVQFGDLMADMTAGPAASLATPWSRSDVASFFGGEPGSSVMGNYCGHFLNVPVFQSSNVGLDGDTSAREGGIFVARDAQNSTNCAIGLVWKWMPEVAQADLLTNRMIGRVMRGRMAFGAAEINDGCGVLITSDA